jgi:hypothetical protein
MISVQACPHAASGPWPATMLRPEASSMIDKAKIRHVPKQLTMRVVLSTRASVQAVLIFVFVGFPCQEVKSAVLPV